MKKKIITLVLLFAFCCVGLIGCGYSSQEPCVWCNKTPTKQFSVGNSSGYYCEECSSQCMWCGKKATKQYVNGLGILTFTCSDCYNEVRNAFK